MMFAVLGCFCCCRFAMLRRLMQWQQSLQVSVWGGLEWGEWSGWEGGVGKGKLIEDT